MINHGVWLVDDKDNPTKSLVYIWDGTNDTRCCLVVGATPNLEISDDSTRVPSIRRTTLHLDSLHQRTHQSCSSR